MTRPHGAAGAGSAVSTDSTAGADPTASTGLRPRRVGWGWLAAALAAAVLTVLLAGSRSGTCTAPAPGGAAECVTTGPGGVPTLLVVVVGLVATAVLAHRALRRHLR